jgi:hypothetical protein
MTTRGPTAKEILLNAATDAAIALAKLAVEHHYDSPEHMIVDKAWKTIREVFIAAAWLKPAPAHSLRIDLDELYQNTKGHARADGMSKDAVAFERLGESLSRKAGR